MFEGKWVRKVIATTFIILCLLLFLFPFITKPSVVKNEEGRARRQTIDKVRINQKSSKSNTYKNRETNKGRQKRGETE